MGLIRFITFIPIKIYIMQKITCLYIIIIAITAIFFIACNKNSNSNTPTIKTETPLNALIKNGFLDSTITFTNSTSFEMGYSFSSSKNGILTQLGGLFPDKKSYRVALWDSASQTLLDSAIIQVRDTSKFNYTAISPINIIAKRKYIITTNNQDGAKRYFILLRKVPNQLQLPVQSGNITIHQEMEKRCSQACFPIVNSSIFLPGMPDFEFKPTE